MQRQRVSDHYCRDQQEVTTASSTEGLTHQGGSDETPAGSPSITPTPSPPRQLTGPKQTGRPQATKSSSSIRLTGSKRALSSRSNQDSARQLMTKQRIGRASTVGVRLSSDARRLSCAAITDASDSLDGVGHSGSVSEAATAGEGAADRAGALGQHSRALLRQSVDAKQGNSQAVHMSRAESQGAAAKSAAARKASSKTVSLSSLG